MSLLQRIIFNRNLQIRSLSSSVVRLTKSQDNNSSSDSESSSDDERKIKKSQLPKENKKEESAKKLNVLLKTMMEEKTSNSLIENKLKLAKPREKQRNLHLKENENKSQEKFGERLTNAAKIAAKELGGDVKKNEAELLSKLLFKSKQINEEDSQEVTSSDVKRKKHESDLGTLTLNELLTDMKIDRSKPKQSVSHLESRAAQVRNILGLSKRMDSKKMESRKKVHAYDGPVSGERVDIFGAEPLGIFDPTDLTDNKNDITLETWDKCYKRELKLATTQPPTNIYEQMILWNEKGMIWNFPIDNEQGLDEEKKVPFYEHIHLERHLEGWCPNKGPIRHFMELVCVGLSKNPWLTVDEKLQHIIWFKEFFSGKSKLIKEIGAGDIQIENTKYAKL